MKKDIHPNYTKITAICSCGNIINTRSTISHDLNLDVCGICHPFLTGKKFFIGKNSRVDKFKKFLKFPGRK